MLWILISLFFIWLFCREIRNSIVAPVGYDFPRPASKPFLAAMLALALVFAWPPFQNWHFQRFLSAKATEIADAHPAKVHCNTIVDTMFDQHMLASAHADPKTGEIDIQYPWCKTLRAFLAHPDRASEEEIDSLNLLTHESMHVRGEYNEALTECEAVQRNYRAAKILGVPARIAKKDALAYYYGDYMRREQIGGLAGSYYSDQCAPGRGMDEYLSDSTWAAN
jgi:hypothetical protein